MNYTPGPWEVEAGSYPLGETGDYEPYCLVKNSQKIIVADIRPRGGDEEEQDANASLIAAAPDLLEALIALVSVVAKEYGGEIKYRPVAVGQYLDSAGRAIAKAEATAKI